jgi:hypothetical protein
LTFCIFDNHGYIAGILVFWEQQSWTTLIPGVGILVQFLIPTQHGYDPLAIIWANLSIGLFMLWWVHKLKCTNCIVKFFWVIEGVLLSHG